MAAREDVQFRLLGPVQVRVGDIIVPLGGRHPQAIMASLIARAGTSLSVADLVAAAWGDDPPRTAPTQARNRVSELRSALRAAGAPDLITSTAGGYLLTAPPGSRDVDVFDTHVTRANVLVRQGGWHDAAYHLRQALSLRRGAALAGLGEGWLGALARALTERCDAAYEELIHCELELGRHDVVIAELDPFLAAHPWRERAVGMLMTALHRTGRQRDALLAYDRLRSRLAEDLGIDPGRELTRLRDELLRVASPAPVAAPQPFAAVKAPAIRQLPAPLADFVGRAEEVAAIRATVAERLAAGAAPVVAVSGLPGVGKTSLALAVLHTLAGELDAGHLFADLRGHAEPRQPRLILHGFLRTLGVEPDALPQDLDEASALYRSMLAERRLLVLLDNAADVAQLAPLLPGPECPVIVTSRRRLIDLDGAAFVQLEPWSEREALLMLERLSGSFRTEADRRAAVAIAGYCGYLPLATRISGTRAMASPSGLQAVAAQLVDASRRLDRLTSPERGVRMSLSSGYAALSPDEQRLLRRLAIVTTDTFPEWVAAEVFGSEDGPHRLAALVESSFVTAQGADALGQQRFRLHDLVRTFAADRARDEEPGAALRDLLDRVARAWQCLAEEADMALYYADAFARPPKSGHVAPIDVHRRDPRTWFAIECTSILDMVERCAEAGIAEWQWKLIYNVEGYLRMEARTAEVRSRGRRALEAVQETGDAEGIASISMSIAFAALLEDDLQAASDDIGRALGLAGQLDDRWLLAEIYTVAAHIYNGLADTAAELTALEHATEHYLAVGDMAEAGVKLTALGDIAARTGDATAAGGYYVRGVGLLRTADASLPLAHGLRRMARFHRDRGNWPEAIGAYAECLSLVERERDPVGELVVRSELAVTLANAGQLADARLHAHQALGLAEQVSLPQYAGYAHFAQAVVHARGHDYGSANRELEGCVDALRANPTFLLEAQIEYGGVLAALGERERAAVVFGEASDLAGKLENSRLEQAARDGMAAATAPLGFRAARSAVPRADDGEIS
ncbi:AfsR/SARP family transcriptional regulator [Catellatospora bangladeshensis]|uniref:SARP family transcriptional regulator n=1 Tax=Catellatospora bangladeshensis TaxID=310355 RepID=A0A8J3JQN3_9ACTN|nr:BTAD domain-containing putative transcriptional regulator [Catellatospora bangladeshensis]GIF84908.1 SARP family transcriptional regulator [Catellatospora bangladeshensis]